MSATGERGFTLLEMMIAVAIMALITGLGWPAVGQLLSRTALAQARGTLTLTIARARNLALTRDAPVTVSLTAETPAQLVLSDGAAIALPRGVSIDWPAGGVVIYGDGSTAGATGLIHIGAAGSRYTVDPATARASFAP
ncbi:pilus assembly FimT family protein [Novosphingobium sp.]|uniref:pilus assembly FimT family protein n=1 Tax=Novosphingobium sp. TaxID=1874826 RepID=UPI003D09DCC9